MTESQFTWYEFFAGGGMARLGLGNRWECIFANEWCEKKAQAYRAYFGPCNELRVLDVGKLTVDDLPGRPNLVWASFPCQDLSLAGSGAGLNGERSGTFKKFWRLMEGLVEISRAPDLIVLENVVGTITSHGGSDFAAIVRAFSRSNYRVGAVIVDAVHFLPQSRPRLFVVGTRQDLPVPGQLESPIPNQPWHTNSLVRAQEMLPESLRETRAPAMLSGVRDGNHSQR